MNEKNNTTEKLNKPFSPTQIEWLMRKKIDNETKAIVVPYVKRPAIEERLDIAFGPLGWSTDFILWRDSQNKPDKNKTDGFKVINKDSQLCGISIFDSNKNQWVTKYDGAENTDYEPIKGGLTAAFKRAAKKWGIGRYLDYIPSKIAAIEPFGNSHRIKAADQEVLNKYYISELDKILESNYLFKTICKPKDNNANARMENHPSENKENIYPITNVQSEAVSSNAKPYEYYINKIKTYENSSTVCLDLVDDNGEVISVFMKNLQPDIKQGAFLNNVTMSLIPNANPTVKSYKIDSYEIVNGVQQNAA